MNKNEQEVFNFTKLLLFYWKYRKAIIIVTTIGAILSVIVSLLIEDKYKSTVILFPTSTNSISKSLMSESIQQDQDIMQFGEEEQAEQLIQVLNSDQIRNRIIKKYKLMSHYEIDSTSKYKMTNLFREYASNISFQRTEFMSVKIEVMDRNPKYAANIANDIANLVDSVKTKMQRQRVLKAYKIVEKEYFSLRNYIQQLEDSLVKLRAKGVQDPEAQSEVYTEQYSIALSKNNTRAMAIILSKLDTLAKYGGNYISIRDQLEYEKKELTKLKMRYKEAKMDASADIPHKFVLDRAYPAERKSYPIRWLIVVASTISTFLFISILLMITENIKKKDFQLALKQLKEQQKR